MRKTYFLNTVYGSILATLVSTRNRFSSRIKFFNLLLLVLLVSGESWGQSASATWALTSDASSVNVGNISTGNASKGSGVGTVTYTTNGISSNGWGTTGLDVNDYYQFSITPSVNNNLTISSISSTNNLSSQTATGEIQYSYNSSFTSPVSVGTAFSLSSTSSITNYTSLSIPVSSGQTLYVRLFVYKGTGNTITSSQTVRCKNFTITGTTVSTSTPTKLAVTSITPTIPTAGSTFNVTIQAQDDSNVAGNVTNATDISLSNTGGGTIGGITTGTITAGSSSVTITGVTLSSAGTGVSLTATRTSGDVLTASTSSSFNVLAATPSTQSSGMSFGTQTTSSIPLTSWTVGNGANRIVVARLATTTRVAPAAGIGYAVNSASFTDVSNVTTGTGNVVIYNGSGNSVTPSNLNPGTQYSFDIYEYNGSGVTANYGSVYTVNRYTLQTEPTSHTSTFTVTSLSTTSLTLNFDNTGSTLGYLILYRIGNVASTGTPTDATSYTAGADFGTGKVAAFVTTNSITSASITGLTAGTEYTFSIIPFGRNTAFVESYNYYTGGVKPTLSVSTYATAPTSASAVSVSNRYANSIDLTWTNGNGAGRIVIARTVSAVAPTKGTAYPNNSSSFTDNLNATTATGNIVVYNGTGSGNTLTVTGLSTSINYKFDVYEYNGTDATLNYAAAATSATNIYTLAPEPTTQASGVTFSNITATTMTIGFTKGDETSTGRLVLVKESSAVDSNPVDGTSYSSNTTFKSGTQLGIGNYVVYSGSGTSVSITGLTANTTYSVAVFEFNGTITGTTTNFLTSSPATESQITLVTPPAAPTALTFGSVSYNSLQATFTAPVVEPSGYLVIRRKGAVISGTPVGGTEYTAGQSIGALANEIIYVGASPWSAYAQTGLTDNTTYYYAVYSYTSAGTQTNYSTALTGSQLTSAISAPTANPASNISSTGFTANWDALAGATGGYLLDVSTSSNFGTATPATLTEGFETGLSGSYITSGTATLGSGVWSFKYGGLDVTGTGNFNSGTHGCQLKANTGVATAPSISNVSTVTFYVKSPNGASTLDVMKIVNGGAAVLVETKNITSAWAQYTVAVNETSSDVQISFVNGASYVLIDDVSIGYSTTVPSFVSGYNAKAISGQSTIFSDVSSGISANTAYYYRVRAVGGSSTSANSNTISATTLASYTIAASSNDDAKGSVSGGGAKDAGTSVSLTATASEGYRFVNWTEGGSFVSIANPYTFTALANRTLVANFADFTSTITSATNASTIADCPTCNVVISNTGTLTIDGTKEYNSITVESGGKLNTSQPLTVGNLVFKAVKDASSFSSKIDAAITATSVKLYKTIDDTKWYYMAFPCDVTVAAITKSNGDAMTGLGTDWFIKYYDGAQRGESGTTATNWKHIGAITTLTANRGYIFGLKTGEVELSIPLNTSVLAAEEADKNIAVAANAGAAANTNHGWNLIGHPYMSTYNAQSNASAPNYMIMPNTDGKTYTQTSKAGSSLPTGLKPFAAYFVQAGGAGNISFGLNGRQSVPASVAAEVSENIKLNFTTATGTDYTYLIMDNNQTTGYQIGEDMVKWLGTGTDIPQLYTLMGDISYAFNALPMASVVNLPVGLYTKTAGTSTMSVNAAQAPSLSKLLLTDKTENITTDLLLSDYSFSATAGTDNTRFVISAQRVPTANPINLTDAPSMLSSNGKLVINELSPKSTIRIYDAIGRNVFNKVAMESSIEIPLQVVGMYTVHIDSGIKNWTIKIVNNK